LRAPNTTVTNGVPDAQQVTSMIASFKSNGYKLKQVFAESAAYCMGN